MTKLTVNPVPSMTLRQAVDLGGIIVCVYKDEVSVLLPSLANRVASAGFVSMRIIGDCNTRHTCTTGTVDKLVKRLEDNPLDCDSSTFYHFNNLHEFAKAVIENNWRT